MRDGGFICHPFSRHLWLESLVFIGVLVVFQDDAHPSPFLAGIPHPFQWKNVTFYVFEASETWFCAPCPPISSKKVTDGVTLQNILVVMERIGNQKVVIKKVRDRVRDERGIPHPS